MNIYQLSYVQTCPELEGFKKNVFKVFPNAWGILTDQIKCNGNRDTFTHWFYKAYYRKTSLNISSLFY